VKNHGAGLWLAGESLNRTGRLKFHQVYYVLDAQLRVLWIGGEWDEFAMANGGEVARANEVLSTSIKKHIADAETTDAVVRLIEAVQETGSVLRIDYRCDSFALLRRFQLTIQPMKDERVLLVHDLKDAKTFATPHAPWRHTHGASHGKCSFCCSVHWPDGVWQDAGLLTEPHPEKVALTLCPSCLGRVDEAIVALRANRAPNTPVTGGLGPSTVS
jgi:hypothetical protein